MPKANPGRSTEAVDASAVSRAAADAALVAFDDSSRCNWLDSGAKVR